MVEYGVPHVCDEWKGHVVLLHPEFEDHERVQELEAKPEILGRRILNRHRLLTVAGGAWLPKPDRSECTYCEFGSGKSVSAFGALPCNFHCQMERSWDCQGATEEQTCPLVGTCSEHARYVHFDTIDRYNEYRALLLDEEHERSAVRRLLEGIAESDAAERAGLCVHVEVLTAEVGLIKARLPARLSRLSDGSPLDVLTAFGAGGRQWRVVVEDRSGDIVTLRDLRRDRRIPAAGEHWLLKRDLGDTTPLRDMLRRLEQEQRVEAPRAGQPPIAGGPREVTIREHASLDGLGTDLELVLVDAPGVETRDAALGTIVDRLPKPVVVVCGRDMPVEIPGAVDLRDRALLSHFNAGSLSAEVKVNQVVDKARKAQVLIVPRERLYDTLAESATSERRPFRSVVVLEAETFPLLGIRRCFDLADRVALLGQAAASGPPAQSRRVRTSPLFQNTLRYLIDTAKFTAGEVASRVDIVRLRARRGVAKAGAVLNFGIEAAVGLAFHVVTGEPTCIGGDTGLRIVAQVATSALNAARRRIVEVELIDSDGLSAQHVELLLKSVTAQSIEALEVNPSDDKIDTSLLGRPVRLVSVQPKPATAELPDHELSVRWPATLFPSIEERLYVNEGEARELVRFAKACGEPCIATSPFIAQCSLLSELAEEEHLENLRVLSLERLGNEGSASTARHLLISTVVGKGAPTYPYPMNESGRLLPLLVGPYSRIDVFASPEALRHHPLLRSLANEG